MKATHCELIRSHLSEMFECSPHGRFVRIRTPFLYPDGDVIDLFADEANGVGAVSDLGESSAWLRMQTAAARRSPRQKQLIDDVGLTLGVECFKGMLSARYRDGASLADAVQRVGQAAVRVTDLWFTFRSREFASFNDDVSGLLENRKIDFVRDEKLPGRSGRVWTVDFHARTAKKSSLVLVASTGNKSAAKKISEHVVAAWHDLSHVIAGREGAQPVTLVDDTADVWSDDDLRLMESLSSVARWSSPGEFVDLLQAA